MNKSKNRVSFFKNLIDLLFLYKKEVFYGYLFLLILTASLSLKVKFLVEIEEIIDSSFSSYSNDLKKFVGEKDLYLLLSNQEKQFTNNEVCELSRWWAREIKENKDLESSFASFEATQVSFGKHKFTLKEYVTYECQKEKEQLPVRLTDLDHSPWRGILSPLEKNNELLITFSVRPLQSRGIFGSFNSKAVANLFNSFQKTQFMESSHIKVTWGGSGVYFYYLVKGYLYSIVLNVLSILLICTVLSFLFRSWKTGLLFYILYQLVIIPIFSLMGALNFDLDTLSNTLPIMVLLACLQDFIFITYYYDRDKQGSAFRNLLIPGFLTSLTTAVGFGSLMTADLAIIRRFGFITSVAALLEFFVMFFVFQGLLSIGLFRNWKPQPRIQKNLNFKILIPKKMAFFLLIIPFVFVFQIKKLNFIDFPENLFPRSHSIQEGAQVFLEKFGWVSTVNLIYNEDQSLFIKDQVLPEIEKHKIVSRIENFERVLDSFSEKSSEEERRILESNIMDTGYGKKMIAVRGPLRRTIIYVKSSINTEITDLWEKINFLCKGNCQFVGDLVSYTEFSNSVVAGFHKSTISSFMLVLSLIFFVAFWRKEKRPWLLVLASMWGPLALLSFFIILQVPIFFVTSIVISIIMGLTGDNALFFLLSDPKKKANEQAKKMATISMVVMICYLIVIACLLFSYFGALRSLSALMLLGLIFSLFGDLVLFLSLYERVSFTNTKILKVGSSV